MEARHIVGARPRTKATMQPYWHYHIDAYTYHDYRPASQAVFSVVYTSVTMVRQYYFQCKQTIYRRCPIGAHTYHDYRPALQAVFSVIYMSVIVVSQCESSE